MTFKPSRERSCQPCSLRSAAQISINGALLEGFATALAPRAREHLDLHDQAAILDRLDKRPPLQSIMGPGFWGQSSSRAYATAGSFALWLLEHHGAAKLGDLYAHGGDVEQAQPEERPARDAEGPGGGAGGG